MVIYRCSACGNIVRVPSPPTISKCGACGGWLVTITREDAPKPMIVEKVKENEGKQGMTLLNIVKVIAYAWGTSGALRIVAKLIEKENIGRGDLLHTIIPFTAPSIIDDLCRQQSAGNLPISSLSGIGMQPQRREEKAQSLVESTEEEERETGSPDLPKMWTPKKLDSHPEEVKGSLERFEELKKLLKHLKTRAPSSLERPEDPRALQWRAVLSRYPRILILGGQGTGKSSLAYYLLEILHDRGRCYVYRLPEEGIPLIPKWLGICREIADVPPRSIVLVDEAYLPFFSRESQSRGNRELTKIINLARQKKMGLIFVAHESRHLDKNILSGIDTLIIKKPAPLQVVLDRSFLKPYLLKAERIFQGKGDASAKTTSYIPFSPGRFEGELENPKPSFWSEKISHIFASGYIGREERPARELTKEEKRKRAKKLRDDYGYSYGDIGKNLGVGKTTIYRWLTGKTESGTTR